MTTMPIPHPTTNMYTHSHTLLSWLAHPASLAMHWAPAAVKVGPPSPPYHSCKGWTCFRSPNT